MYLILCSYLDSLVFDGAVNVNELTVDGKLDGVNAAEVLSNVVTEGESAIEFGVLRVDHLTIDGDLNITSGMINEVDIVALNASALRINGQQEVSGSLGFEQVKITHSFTSIKYVDSANYNRISCRALYFKRICKLPS